MNVYALHSLVEVRASVADEDIFGDDDLNTATDSDAVLNTSSARKANGRRNAFDSATASDAVRMKRSAELQEFEDEIYDSAVPAIKETAIEETSEISKEQMRALIEKLDTPDEMESDAYRLNEKRIVLNVGENAQIALIKRETEEAVEGVQWFCKTVYPYNTVYSAEEEMPEGILRLAADGTVTALSPTGKPPHEAELWAYYRGFLYRCNVQVRSEAEMELARQEKALEEKAEEIIAPMEGLSDIEKVKAAHDWIVENISYRMGRGDSTAYQGIVGGSGVCTGYSQSYKYLLDKLDINNALITGTIVRNGERHM